MNNNIDFSSLKKKDSFEGNGNINNVDTSTKEFSIFTGMFFLIGDTFQFPPKKEIRIYLDTFHGHLMPVANIIKNSKLDWRPVRAFCRVCSKDPDKFLADVDAISKTLGYNACNRDFIESGDVVTLLQNFAGKTVKVIARVPAFRGTKFVKGEGATEHIITTLPVFAIV